MYDQDGNKMGQTLTRHYDSTDYGAIVTRPAEILPLSVVTANWGYDSDHFALILAQNVCLVLSYLDRLVWICLKMDSYWVSLI